MRADERHTVTFTMMITMHPGLFVLKATHFLRFGLFSWCCTSTILQATCCSALRVMRLELCRHGPVSQGILALSS